MTRAALLVAFASVLISASFASASPIASIGANVSYERGADGRTYTPRVPFSLRGGYRFEMADAFLEYSMFRASEGESMISVTREQHEFLLWGRHLFRKEWRVSPFAGAGVGFHFERIETKFASDVSRETGDADPVAAVAAGLRWNVIRGFELIGEARGAFAARYSPNPMLGIGLGAGVSF